MMKTEFKKKRAFTFMFVSVMVLLVYVSPLITAQAATGTTPESGKAPYFPGLPDNAVQYNKTDTIPVAETEQVMAGEPTLFQYTNMTMLMNCTQNCEIVVTAEPEVTPKIFGFSIDPNQAMELTMNLSGSPLQGETVMERTLNFYLGIEPNATLQLTAQIRLHINQTELSQELNRDVNASRLTWMYWNRTEGDWEAVESYLDEDGFLVCETDHFSTWTVAEVESAEETQFVVNIVYFFAVVIIAVCVVAVVAFKLRS